MSSTNRGGYRHNLDYYVTPVNEIEKFWKEFNNKNDLSGIKLIVDSCAGGDSKHEMSYPSVINKMLLNDHDLITLDIRNDSLAQYKPVDYLKCNILDYVSKKPQMIISNPPFKNAFEFIQKALDDVCDDGYVVMLLRLNFLGSKVRNEWLRNNMPSEIYVHSKRMSFTDNGKTDSIEYAHFVWRKGYKGVTRLYLLEFE